MLIKKILIAAAIATTITACSTDKVIEQPQPIPVEQPQPAPSQSTTTVIQEK